MSNNVVLLSKKMSFADDASLSSTEVMSTNSDETTASNDETTTSNDEITASHDDRTVSNDDTIATNGERDKWLNDLDKQDYTQNIWKTLHGGIFNKVGQRGMRSRRHLQVETSTMEQQPYTLVVADPDSKSSKSTKHVPLHSITAVQATWKHGKGCLVLETKTRNFVFESKDFKLIESWEDGLSTLLAQMSTWNGGKFDSSTSDHMIY